MPKPYVSPSREGLVPITVYVKPEIRQALKIAAAQHNTTVADIMVTAIAYALKKFARPKDGRHVQRHPLRATHPSYGGWPRWPAPCCLPGRTVSAHPAGRRSGSGSVHGLSW